MSSSVSHWTLFSLLEADFVDNIRFALVFGSAGNEAIIVTDDDLVFGLGTNACSCLGICKGFSRKPSGTGSGHSTLRPVGIEALSGRNVVSAAFGAGPHVLALTHDGQVFAWGHNAYGQLGVGHTTAGVLPSPLACSPGLSDARVTAVACGAHHSAALTHNGELYTWGHNGHGQLGLGHAQPAQQQHTNVPKRVVAGGLSETLISAVVCGQNTTIALTDAGRVYTCGYNGNGQLGVGTVVDAATPQPLLELVNVRLAAVASGFAHSLALSDDGCLYAWGSNSCGQLGPGPSSRANQTTPVRVAAQLGRIVTVAAVHACNMTAVQTADDRVHMWGQLRGQSVPQPQCTLFACVDDAFACFAAPPVSWRPVRFAKPSHSGVQSHIGAAFDDPSTSDLRIKVDGKAIHAHRALLKIRCAHFRTMFKDVWLQHEAKDNANEVEMSQYSYPVYRAFIKYLYTDCVDDATQQPGYGQDELALGLLDLATAYCEPVLRERCCALIKRHLDVGNALVMYAAALRYDADDLRQHCLEYCVQRMSAVATNDALSQLDAPTLRTFLQDAARHGAFRH